MKDPVGTLLRCSLTLQVRETDIKKNNLSDLIYEYGVSLLYLHLVCLRPLIFHLGLETFKGATSVTCIFRFSFFNLASGSELQLNFVWWPGSSTPF